ncbi:MAG TPA: hypothetical protein VJG32_22655 [Anaerolineae bacterium]|nr:hypothetical protein [Anaerolineae bacterium]
MTMTHTLGRIVRFLFAMAFAVSSVMPPAVLAASARVRPSDVVSTRLRPAPIVSTASRVAEPTRPVWLPVTIVNPTAARSSAPVNSIRLLPPPARSAQAGVSDELRICDVEGDCSGLTTSTFATDAPLILYAAGYSNTTFVANQLVTWTVSSGLATPSPSEGISATLDGNTPGTLVVTATLVADPAIFATATLNVVVGSLEHITIRDTAGGGGNVVSGNTLAAGETWTLYAAGYDVDNNFIADQSVNWTLNGDIGSRAPASGTSTTFTAGTAGSGSIVAEFSPTITDSTGTITVVHGGLDHFSITLPPNGTAGIGFTAIITAEDLANNTVLTFTGGLTAALSTSNGGDIAPDSIAPTNGVWNGSVLLTTAGSNRNVTVSSGSVSDQATIDIDPGAPDTLEISPASATRTAGSSISYTAVATDTYGNFIGNVTGSTNFSIDPGAGDTFTLNTVTPIISGAWTVTGTNGNATGNASLTVNPGSAYTVTLTPATAVISAGTSISYAASATDVYGNSLGNVTGSTSFSASPGAGATISGNVVTPTVSGNWTITGTHAGRSDTAALGVTSGPLTLIDVRPSSASIVAGTRFTYTAVASDTFGNFIGDVTGNTAFAISPGAGASFNGSIVTPTVAGSWTVTGATGAISDTAQLTVTPNVPYTLTLAPATAVISAGVRITYTATATDTFGNFIGNVTPSTAFAISPGAGASFNGSVVTPTIAGSWTVTGANGSARDTAALSVTPNVPYTLTLTPATAVISAGQRITYTAVATDTFGNFIGNVTSGTSFAISPGASFSGSVVTPTVAGSWTVTGANGSARDTAALSVSPNVPYTLTLAPATAVISAGVRITYTATATDTFGNFIGNVTSGTSFAISPGAGASFSGSVVTPTVAGSWTVTGTHSDTGVLDTAVVSVTPNVPYTLTLAPATAVISAGVRITYTAVATDTFGNPIGDVTASTVFSIPVASGGTFVGNAVTPTVAGTWAVTGTEGSAIDISLLTVTPAGYYRLSIENGPPGTGQPVNALTMTVYNTLTLYAVSYDVYSNTIGGEVANWVASGVLSGTLSQSSGISTTINPAPIISGAGFVTATFGITRDVAGPITILAPVLRISKFDSPDPVTPGEMLQYTIVYTNVGNATALNTLITETYPLSTSFLLAFPGPTFSTNVWSISDIPPGVTGSISVYVRLASQYPVSSVLTNTVRFGGPQVATAMFTETTQVAASPDVTVSKSDSTDLVRVGDPLVYTIQFNNSGTGSVTGIRITETYPSEVVFQSAIPTPTIGNNVWLTSSQSGLIQVTVRVRSPLPDETILDNQVTIDTNQTTPFTTQETTRVAAPMLTLTKSASAGAPLANSVLTYTLRYTNSGSTPDSYASNVVVTDAVPLNTTYLSCAPVGCSQLGGIVEWDLGTVPALTSGVLTMTVGVNNNLDNGTLLTNTARIRATENISAFVRITSTVVSTPVLSLSKSDGVTSAAAGQALTYTLRYTNSGNARAQSVVITDRIPSNVSFLTCTGGCVSVGGGVYSFTLNTITATTSGAVTVTVRLNPTLPAGLRAITNTARIQTGTLGDNPADNFTQDVDTISTVPALAMSVSFSSTTPYPTKVITYVVRYTNTSAMDTTGVVISVTKSPYVSYMAGSSSSWTPPDTGYIYTYNIGNLPAGAASVLMFTVRLPYPFTSEMLSFVNTFLIHDNGPSGLPIAASLYTATIGIPDLVIDSVTVSPSTVSVGQLFTATVVIRNEGTGRACNPKTELTVPPTPCGSFGLDWFIGLSAPPLSFPFERYGNGFVYVNPINPGSTRIIQITGLSFTSTQTSTLAFKVDNWNCNDGSHPCLPDDMAQHGLIPENDEFNNVFGPMPVPTPPINRVFIPVVMKNK